MTETERCGSCRFFRPDDVHDALGACLRRSPVATGGMMSAPETIWPQISVADWCGEYVPNAAEQSRLAAERDAAFGEVTF